MTAPTSSPSCWLCDRSDVPLTWVPTAGFNDGGAHQCARCTEYLDRCPVGRENVYTCTSCGRHLVTVDRDRGTTPMFIGCGDHAHGCRKGMMGSAMYPRSPRPAWLGAPTHEWYRPRGAELERIQKREPRVWDHVRRGGLLLRRIARRGVQ